MYFCRSRAALRSASVGGAQIMGLPPGDYVEIAVSDTGEGMAEEVAQRAFEPFFTTKDVGKGTGLGTVITQRIINEHNGRIEVDSSPGNGTTMTILLPIHHE